MLTPYFESIYSPNIHAGHTCRKDIDVMEKYNSNKYSKKKRTMTDRMRAVACGFNFSQ